MLADYMARLKSRGAVVKLAATPDPQAQAHAQALRNYLLLVSRAHGLTPHTIQPGYLPDNNAVLHQMLMEALGGDAHSLAAYHDLNQDLTGNPLPSPGLLHEAPGDSIEDILAGLHHRSLLTNYHRGRLPIERMFSIDGLTEVPGLAGEIRRRGGFQHVRNMVNRAHALQTPELSPLVDATNRHAEAAAQGGSMTHIPHLIDLLHQMNTAVQGTPDSQFGALGTGLRNVLHYGLGALEQHHLGY